MYAMLQAATCDLPMPVFIFLYTFLGTLYVAFLILLVFATVWWCVASSMGRDIAHWWERRAFHRARIDELRETISRQHQTIQNLRTQLNTYKHKEGGND